MNVRFVAVASMIHVAVVVVDVLEGPSPVAAGYIFVVANNFFRRVWPALAAAWAPMRTGSVGYVGNVGYVGYVANLHDTCVFVLLKA